jgi:hypothetical protein
MSIEPTPRTGIYDYYWTFAAERQRAFEARVAGAPQPWSDDRILQTYKFCNVYRAADRVSQYLIREVCYNTEQHSAEDLIFQIVAFRTFSNIATWRGIVYELGHAPTIANLADGSFTRAIEATLLQNGKLYTGAFILCASDAYGMTRKHLNHVELFKDMFLLSSMASAILDAPSLRSIYDVLHTFPLMGDFMSYQIAIDINYSDLVDFSENEFTQAGPGAVRGIRKVFADTAGMSSSDVINWMVDHQDQEFKRLGLPFNGLWGRKIHAIDAQNLFCETDKYCREAAPSLASNRTRIKARFSPTESSINYFFPPKWNLNEKLSLPARDLELVGA